MLGLEGNFVVGAQRDVHDAVLVGALALKAAVTKYVEHMTVRRHHFGGELEDAGAVRDAPQCSSNNVAIPRPWYSSSTANATSARFRSCQAKIAANPDETLFAILDERGREANLVVEIEFREARKFIPGQGALGTEEPV